MLCLLKEILLKIGFIEEMRTIRDNKEVPKTFFHNHLYSRQYDFITKGIILQKFSQTKKRDYQLVAVSRLQPNLKTWQRLLEPAHIGYQY